jgi:hypothetical protein
LNNAQKTQGTKLKPLIRHFSKKKKKTTKFLQQVSTCSPNINIFSFLLSCMAYSQILAKYFCG